MTAASSLTVAELVIATGISFIGLTNTVMDFVTSPLLPSLMVYVNVSVPLKFVFGVYFS